MASTMVGKKQQPAQKAKKVEKDSPAKVEAPKKAATQAETGKKTKQVFMPKKTITANDGLGDWEMVEQKRETYTVEKSDESSEDDAFFMPRR